MRPAFSRLQSSAIPESVSRELLAIETADNIARRYSYTTQWSTWHSWDYIRSEAAFNSRDGGGIWTALHPFATCVGFCFPVAEALRAAYSQVKGEWEFPSKTA